MEDQLTPETTDTAQNIQPRDLVVEMQQSYLDYAMSVIVSRALPDARDGLKPVGRRILYVMGERGLRSGSKFNKSAQIVGQVMGDYHPHGNMAIYDAMVRMAQWFSLREPLVDGQGNFGSMDGDSAAADRYTEARLAKVSDELLADLDKETVPMVPNYTGSLVEPSVLPTKVPNLLLNGGVGIAVGMATNIPPHNLGELCDGVVALIDKPESTIEELMEHIPAPDFPTGATVYAGQGLRDAYLTGRGKVVMRGVAEVEERKGGFRIVITELPYQVNKAELVSKIADLVKDKKIDGVTDVRDESNRLGIRVVVELKATSYPKKVLNRLYDLTPLQSAFHVNMLALVNEVEPRVLTLKEALEEFIKHRQVVVRRRAEFDLRKAKERAHILEGLLKALDAIDEVVKIIRASKTTEQAREALIARFGFTEIQANAILDMRLARLVGLERDRLQAEYDEKMRLIAELEALLADEAKIFAVIREETLEIKAKYPSERRTKIIPGELGEFRAEDLIPDEEVIVSFTKTGYVKRVPRDAYRSQNRGGKGVTGQSLKDDDEVAFLLNARTHDQLFLFTDSGKLFVTPVYELPAAQRQAKGTPVVNIAQIMPTDRVTAVLALTKAAVKTGGYFVMGTTDGTIKKTEVAAYANVRKNGIIAINLAKGNELHWVRQTAGKDSVLMVSRAGQAILFKEEDVRPTGRSASGVRGMKLKPDDVVVSMDTLTAEQLQTDDVLTVFARGFGKRTSLAQFDSQNRGGMGVKVGDVTPRTGPVAHASVVPAGAPGELMLMSSGGVTLKTPLKDVKQLGRVTQGVTLMKMGEGDQVVSVAVLGEEEKGE